ncbi:MAG: hypothetical protein Q8R70_11915 [Methanoregula sp.]|nr:hypothetical protein [Methanoregula sp.]
MDFFSYEKHVSEGGDEVPGDYPDPLLAAVFALGGISLGQFYNGRPLRGLVWGAGGIAVLLLIRENILLAPAGFIMLGACAIDAYFTAQEIGNHEIPFTGTSCLFWVEVMLAVGLGTALGITTIIRILSLNGVVL